MKIAAVIQYDGTDFCGFQSQKDSPLRTVQCEIENALEVIFSRKTSVTAAGRTDAGVHALGQVVHFRTDKEVNLQKLAISMNGIMKKDVAVKNLYSVPEEFHSRFSAVEREYRYIIHNYPLRTPFSHYRAMWVMAPLDAERMNAAAVYLIGEHDFASFCKTSSSGEGTVRAITRIDVHREKEYIYIDITGNAFLHNQIRTIAGTLVEMEKKNHDPAYMKYVLEKRNRLAAGDTAPPYGLYFMRVAYDPPLESFPSAFC